MNFIPCVAWVPKGTAKAFPDKLQLSTEELKKLVEEAKKPVDSKEGNNSNIDGPQLEDDDDESNDGDNQDDTEADDDSNESDEAGDEELDESDDKDEEGDSSSDTSPNKKDTSSKVDIDEEDQEFNAKYNLDNYDDDEGERPFMNICDVAVHVDDKDDNYITDYNAIEEDDKEEDNDFKIKNNDNLLIVGHVEENSSVLEIYVYNKDDDAFYVHHDIVLPSFPLSIEWLDFHPSDEAPGNYIAVGDMGPVIKIYDMDVVDSLEPDYCLGETKKKKKKLKLECHSDAVISLSWNKHVRNILASGSADSTIIIWDLNEGVAMKKLDFHTGKVQSLLWHNFESSFLLSGCTDGLLRLYDCRSSEEDGFKSWEVEGEIERVCWNLFDSIKFFCSTDTGYVHSIDMRREEIETSVKAHNEAVTALEMCSERPNILLTASMDKTVKLWNIEEVKLVKSFKLKLGTIYTVKFAPDAGMVAAVGGNNPSNNLKIIDIGEKLDESTDNEESSSKDSKKNVRSGQNFLASNSKFKNQKKKRLRE